MKDYQTALKFREFWKHSSYIQYGFQLAIYNYILETCYSGYEFPYKCKEMHIVRLWHDSPGCYVTVYKPDIFRDRIRKIEEMFYKQQQQQF